MFWEGFAAGIAVCVVVALANRFGGQWLAERRVRAAYVKTLSGEKRAELAALLSVNRDWRLFHECQVNTRTAAYVGDYNAGRA